MAVGDLFWFDIATKLGFPDSSAFSSGDTMSCALIEDASITSTSTAHGLGDFTEANSTGSATYPANGSTLDVWGDMWSYSGKVATFDTTTNPTWSQDSDNSTDVTYALVCNITETGKRALCAVELGNVDMTAGDLTITWNASGIATVTST